MLASPAGITLTLFVAPANKQVQKLMRRLSREPLYHLGSLLRHAFALLMTHAQNLEVEPGKHRTVRPRRRARPESGRIVGLLAALLLNACIPSFPTSTDRVDTTPATVTQRAPNLLSAFYGLEALPNLANFICSGAAGMTGMPVVFSLELDIDTLQAADFSVLTKSGETKSVHCVSPGPAVDPGELRTILLMGELGSKEDPPVEVSIVGNLLDETRQYNFKGRSIDVIPLAEGPTMILGEVVPKAEWSNKAPTVRFEATACPDHAQQVVRVVWTGGVSRLDDGDVGDEERQAYRVRVADQEGAEREVVPFALADLNDGDNNHDLCLDTTDQALSVSVRAGILVDPNDDSNPATKVDVTIP